MLELLTDPQAWIAFATLTALELVLGASGGVGTSTRSPFFTVWCVTSMRWAVP